MALHHERVLCHGEEAWALDMADGTHKCACGQVLRLTQTGGWPARREWRPSDRRIAGFELDGAELDAERREDLISSPDFERPFGDVA